MVNAFGRSERSGFACRDLVALALARCSKLEREREAAEFGSRGRSSSNSRIAKGFDLEGNSFRRRRIRVPLVPRVLGRAVVLAAVLVVGEPWRIRIPSPGEAAEEQNWVGRSSIHQKPNTIRTIHRVFSLITLLATRAWLQPELQERRLFTYGPFIPYIPIRSTTIGKSRVAIDPIAMHTSWRSNSDIASVTSIGYPRMSASGESSTTMHRLLHASGSHPIPPPNDPKTNQYNQDLGLIHSTNGNHLESLNEGSSIDHQVTIYRHAQNITMFPTNETWYFASQILVSCSGGLILILMVQSTRN
ncbi:hypothetical protein F511_10273 [Dorcoceras hygrometricum]|uniref:Uncharacterized protein n=1 Tax=Dorcoceras hygrometricum TaxID=472368 RepID=A0A2Z7A507_9LAMI|nr:hypothetical protein F511_10273 [Dorcoceras hygrometricum]